MKKKPEDIEKSRRLWMWLFQIWTKMQGCTYVALIKLDVLSYMEKIRYVQRMRLMETEQTHFHRGIEELKAAKPIYEYLPGFQ